MSTARRAARAAAAAVPVRGRAGLVLVLVSALGLAAFGWPLLGSPGAGLGHDGDAPWLLALLLPLLIVVVLAEIADGGMDAKAVALLGVLAAVGAALRPLGGGATGFQPMFVLLILGGRALGPGFGFVLGSVTMFASALLTGGVGPWLPFQMLAASWVGLGAGLLPRASGRRETALLVGYGAVSGLTFGLAMNLWFWPFVTGTDSSLSFVAGAPLAQNLARFLTFSVVTSLGWDVARAVGNAVLLVAVGPRVLRALRRAARRAAFDVPVVFEPVEPTLPGRR